MLVYTYKKALLIVDLRPKTLGVIIGSFGHEMDPLFALVVFTEVAAVHSFGLLKTFYIVVIVVKLHDYRASVVLKIIPAKRMLQHVHVHEKHTVILIIMLMLNLHGELAQIYRTRIKYQLVFGSFKHHLEFIIKKKISDLKSVRVELLTMAKVRCVNLL